MIALVIAFFETPLFSGVGVSVHMSELCQNIDSPYFAKTAAFGLVVCHLLKKTDLTLVAALLEIVSLCFIFDALRDLVPFVPF